jgi:SsrA-binding protein
VAGKTPGEKLIASNKKVRHEYELLDKYEAGLVLTGSEVKSLREGKVSFKDSYVRIEHGEAWLSGVRIAPYENAGYAQHDPERDKKLLLHGREIALLARKTEAKGLTVVPTRMYFKQGRAKCEIALARGKQVHDKRQAIKDRDLAREAERQLAKYS